MPVGTKIQIRRDTAANWASTNPTLAAGEMGFETDTLRFKTGDGSTAWTSLGYNIVPQKLNLLGSGTYHKSLHAGAEAARTITANVTHFSPFYVPNSTTLDRIAIRTDSTFSGSAVFRLGIYNNDSSDRPSTVLLDAGTVSPTVASTTYEITINQTLSAGWYWLAANCTTAATTNAFLGFPVNTNNATFLGGVSAPGQNTYWSLQQSVTLSGGFATAGTTTGMTNGIIVWVRK